MEKRRREQKEGKWKKNRTAKWTSARTTSSDKKKHKAGSGNYRRGLGHQEKGKKPNPTKPLGAGTENGQKRSLCRKEGRNMAASAATRETGKEKISRKKKTRTTGPVTPPGVSVGGNITKTKSKGGTSARRQFARWQNGQNQGGKDAQI